VGAPAVDLDHEALVRPEEVDADPLALLRQRAREPVGVEDAEQQVLEVRLGGRRGGDVAGQPLRALARERAARLRLVEAPLERRLGTRRSNARSSSAGSRSIIVRATVVTGMPRWTVTSAGCRRARCAVMRGRRTAVGAVTSVSPRSPSPRPSRARSGRGRARFVPAL
jgi:hypothetical protein